MTEKKMIEHKHKDGTKHSHVGEDKPHEHKEITKQTVQVKEHKVDVYTKAYNDTIKRAGSVYSADYKLIDETIEDIKKMSRKVSTNDYSANNVYIILQDALKKVRLAEA